MFGRQIRIHLLSAFVICLSFAVCGDAQEVVSPQTHGSNVSVEARLTSGLPPEVLLLVYANETENSDSFSQQLSLWKSSREPVFLLDQPRWAWYWSSYGSGRAIERSLISGESLEKLLESQPEAVHATLRRMDELAREKIAKDKKAQKERSFDGKYAGLNGDPVLWAILDRTKPIAGHQGLIFPRISSWPSEGELFMMKGEISELTSLKVLAVHLLLEHWADESGVVDELLRRYTGMKPVTKEELVLKEQVRASLKNWQRSDPRVRALPNLPLNNEAVSTKKPASRRPVLDTEDAKRISEEEKSKPLQLVYVLVVVSFVVVVLGVSMVRRRRRR